MLTVVGVSLLGLLAYFIWSDYRDAPDGRSPEKRRSNASRSHHEFASLGGTIALAILLCAWIERSTFGGALGAALFAAVVILDTRSVATRARPTLRANKRTDTQHRFATSWMAHPKSQTR